MRRFSPHSELGAPWAYPFQSYGGKLERRSRDHLLSVYTPTVEPRCYGVGHSSDGRPVATEQVRTVARFSDGPRSFALTPSSLIARIFPRPYRDRKNTAQLVKYPRVLSVKRKTIDVIQGGTPLKFGWGCEARFCKPLPYFRQKYVIFPAIFHTLPKIPYPISDQTPTPFHLLKHSKTSLNS